MDKYKDIDYRWIHYEWMDSLEMDSYGWMEWLELDIYEWMNWLGLDVYGRMEWMETMDAWSDMS